MVTGHVPVFSSSGGVEYYIYYILPEEKPNNKNGKAGRIGTEESRFCAKSFFLFFSVVLFFRGVYEGSMVVGTSMGYG